jgi:hypothetical protein
MIENLSIGRPPIEPSEFNDLYDTIRTSFRHAPLVHRGRVHAQDVSKRPEYATYELSNVMFAYSPATMMKPLQTHVEPNLPWAEDHFQERVGGEPLNPAPSEAWWPFRVEGNAAHKDQGVFSHTYPERMWPKWAGEQYEEMKKSNSADWYPNTGIRYNYGDLNDVVGLLRRDPFTRQAYLPIWFPEDTGSVDGQRVPCSLGYHFIRRDVFLDCQYFMRSCDFFRHFRDDIYMAVRLMQWVCNQIDDTFPIVGNLTVFISNLHAFQGDRPRIDGEV